LKTNLHFDWIFKISTQLISPGVYRPSIRFGTMCSSIAHTQGHRSTPRPSDAIANKIINVGLQN
jgi:hypothetical protein